MRWNSGWIVLALGLAACGGSKPLARGDDQPAAMRPNDIEAARRKASAKLTDAELERMVDQLFIRTDDNRTNFLRLLYAGSRPVPWLIRTLDEPRTWNKEFDSDGDPAEDGSPFHRICQLLEEAAPPEAVRPLTRFATHPNARFRADAAGAIAAIGTIDALGPVKTALTDPDLKVRSGALSGILSGIAKCRRDPTFVNSIFPAVADLLKAGRYEGQGPANVLATLDTARAAAILESAQYFNTRNPQLQQVLRALDSATIKVPMPLLGPLLGELEVAAERDAARQHDYAAALILYARNPDSQAEGRFQILLGSPHEAISDAGARGLEILAGIDPEAAVSEASERLGFVAMTKPQQTYRLVQVYRDQVNTAGHWHFFHDPSGDYYKETVQGLAAVGATLKAGILTNAAHSITPDGPAPATAERLKQMGAAVWTGYVEMSKIDGAFRESEKRPGERLNILLARYAVAHRTDFARQSATGCVPRPPKS
jgi:hypothetical protein